MVTEVAEWVKTKLYRFMTDNLQMPRKFFRGSISDELYERVKFAMQGDGSGPLMYVAIVQEMQQIGTAAAKLIVNEICMLHLCDIPGEDVNTLAITVFEHHL